MPLARLRLVKADKQPKNPSPLEAMASHARLFKFLEDRTAGSAGSDPGKWLWQPPETKLLLTGLYNQRIWTDEELADADRQIRQFDLRISSAGRMEAFVAERIGEPARLEWTFKPLEAFRSLITEYERTEHDVRGGDVRPYLEMCFVALMTC